MEHSQQRDADRSALNCGHPGLNSTHAIRPAPDHHENPALYPAPWPMDRSLSLEVRVLRP